MYAKVFRSIFDGSLYGQFEATIVFLAMLVLADKDGSVDMTPEKLAAAAGYPLDIVLKGIFELEKPDPRSRTPDEDGRRIVHLHSAGWGWQITNYAKYRDIRTSEERREYFRIKKQEQRAAAKELLTCPTISTPVHTVHPSDAESDAYAESDSESDAEKISMSISSTNNGTAQRVFDHWATQHSHRRAKFDVKRRKVIRERLKDYSESDLCQSITGYLNSPHHMGQNDQNTKFDDLELFLRDAKHVDAGLSFFDNPPNKNSKLTQKNVDATANWIPPEMRK